MPQPVRHKPDEIAALAQFLHDPFGHIDVPDFVVGADVIRLSDAPPLDDEIDRPAVVLDMQPVPDVCPFPVKRQALSLQGMRDKKRDELFRILVGPVVVAGPDDDNRQPVRHRV